MHGLRLPGLPASHRLPLTHLLKERHPQAGGSREPAGLSLAKIVSSFFCPHPRSCCQTHALMLG